MSSIVDSNKLSNVKNELSPEKEQEIAQKILERAELAQMTRQLKFGLSKVPTPKSNRVSRLSPSNKRKSSIGSGTIPKEQFLNRLSPKKGLPFVHSKKQLSSNSSNEKLSLNESALKSLDQNFRTDHNKTLKKEANIIQSTAMRKSTSRTDLKDIPIVQPNGIRKSNSKTDLKEVRIIEPTTPGRSSPTAKFQAPSTKYLMMTPNRNARQENSLHLPNTNNNSHDNEMGADLLMYLAASPYSGNKSPGKSQVTATPGRRLSAIGISKVPSTPSSALLYRQLLTDLHDPLQLDESEQPIRLSHIKASISSPNVSLSGNVYSGVNSTFTQNMGLGDVLLDSPTLFNVVSPSTQKKKANVHNNSTLLSMPPTTPSRELKSSGTTANLLKTPNFNMGDYIYNLFSPSPNVTAATSSNVMAPYTSTKTKANNTTNNGGQGSVSGETARFEIKK